MKWLSSKSIGVRLAGISAAFLLLGMPGGAVAQGAATAQSTAAPQGTATTPGTTPTQGAATEKGTAQPTPPPSAVQAAVAVGTDPTTYVIGPEDGLQVTVWKEPTLSGVFPVRPDGMISLALIGDIKAAGQTPMQLAANITQGLKKFMQDPNVSVVVTAVNSRRVYMMGEVGRVGPVVMLPGMTALQAIASVGGLTPFANSKHIYILRSEPGKSEPVKIPFNYKQALKGDTKQLVPLLPGDTIVVP